MIGKLINKDGNWYVEYKAEQAGENAWYNTLPLHPDETNPLGVPCKNNGNGEFHKEGDEVEFEIVEYIDGDDEHGEGGTLPGSCEMYKVAKLIILKQEETNTWDEIYKEFKQVWQDDVDLLYWLKENLFSTC